MVAICSPNFNALSHVRFFKSEKDFENRYKDVLEIRGTASLINKVPRKIKEDKILKKFIMIGFIKGS